jgi:hypothetical protein
MASKLQRKLNKRKGKGRSAKGRGASKKLAIDAFTPGSLQTNMLSSKSMKDSMTTNWTMLVGVLIGATVLYFAFYRYLVSLKEKDCKCATDNWKYEYMMTYTQVLASWYTILVVIILLGLVMGRDYFEVLSKNTFWAFLMSALSLYGFATVWILFVYLREIEEEICACSQDTWRTVLAVLNYMVVIVYAIAILGMIIGGTIINVKQLLKK